MNPLTRLRHRRQLRNWLDMMAAGNTHQRDWRRVRKSGWNQKIFLEGITDARTSIPFVYETGELGHD
jgi:hypothetical protein